MADTPDDRVQRILDEIERLQTRQHELTVELDCARQMRREAVPVGAREMDPAAEQ